MRKLLAIILLISHVNSSLLFPVVEEEDMYYFTKGNVVDEINSVAEFIDEIILKNPDYTPQDEDEHPVKFFHTIKLVNLVDPPLSSTLINPLFTLCENNYGIHAETKILPVAIELFSPPPEVLHT